MMLDTPDTLWKRDELRRLLVLAKEARQDYDTLMLANPTSLRNISLGNEAAKRSYDLLTFLERHRASLFTNN